ncbi:MAG: Na(+)-translocating NADH-quinone reductase subunit A [Candidatus Cloacimonetes bacterium]|jgi:Na+-transporting NADH:ubiquinone oxidoreductase subunit A|nr:Na(+)-translocating NADH-quinone reductase subunit A [Candidatus Cloacimonadota bacterium]MBT4575263.1 Na(+)-translocating NADH-quinone reductase subunit A [Candidatus Cloacimonadota bacterium]MBT5419726.1 Na(+)-translocating NADH-quinone reductase subunit A [Candidatus Cloacimonadota bacterium]
MKVKKLHQGYDIKLVGETVRTIEATPFPKKVAVKPTDFEGLKPKLLIKTGDEVKVGTPLVFHKTNEQIKIISHVSGKISEIIRGERRVIEAIVIEPDEKQVHDDLKIDSNNLTKESIIEALLNSGLFLNFIQRPFNKIANPSDIPRDIFISAMDTAPLAAEAALILQGNENSFQKGLDILSQLTSGKVRLSFKPEDNVFVDFKNCELHNFSGKHPAGNVGVHIHHISPIKNAHDNVWSCSVQAVIQIGKLFETGKIKPEIIVKVAGSAVEKRYYYKTVIGAEVSSFLGKVDEDSRIISGDVLTGKKIELEGFVGFKDNLITVIPEATEPEFLGWLSPGFSKRSWWKTFVAAIITPKKKYKADTNIGGGNRSLVINSIYEEVVPMDILPSYLIKSILAEDIEEMEALGIYEVAEEDFALCEYICPSKTEFQQIIRKGLDLIEKEG